MAFNNIPPNGFPALPDVEDLEAVEKDVTTLKSNVLGLTQDVTDLNAQKANQITIAPFFNAESSYDVGDLVYYNGLTYRCTNAHEGEWDADDFAGTTIANELDSLKSGLTNLFKKQTETATADSNGYFPTSLDANNRAIVSVTSVVINSNTIKPYQYEVLTHGGIGETKLALKVKSWNDTVLGPNETWTVEYIYVEL